MSISISGGGGRELLSADRTYYVRTDGSDSNNGLANTAGGAFLTLQKAMDVIASTLDLAGQGVTVNVGAGTYTAGVNIKPWLGGGSISYIGDETTFSNVFVNPTGANGFDASFGNFIGKFYIKGFKITCTTSGFAIIARSTGRLLYTNIEFGAAAFAQVLPVSGATIEFYGNYTISGGGSSHIYMNQDGRIVCNSNDNPAMGTITLSGSPVFTGGFIACEHGEADLSGITFSGSAGATTPRYTISLNGVINTGSGSATYFPGTAAGTVASGGQYA